MNFKRILLINPHGIGDVLFTTPVVSNLRRAYPDAFICYIGNRRTAQILERNAKIDRVLSYERDEFISVYKRNPFAFFFKWAAFIKLIYQQRADLVIDYSLNSTFGFIAWACAIPIRIGYDYKGRGRYLTNKIVLQGYEGRHVTEYAIDLLRSLNIACPDNKLELPLKQEDQDWAKVWLHKNGVPVKGSLVAVIPGGGASWGAQAKNKRWPARNYADLIHKMIALKGAAVILMGDAKEEQLCSEVARQASLPLYSAVGQTSIVEMAALLKHCRLAVVNDGGPLHIAAAAGVQTVSIFGPVDDAVYGPFPREGHYVVKKGLACQPCYRRFRQASCEHLSCLNNLSVDEVYKTIERLL